MNLRTTLPPITKPPYRFRGTVALPARTVTVEVELRADTDCIIEAFSASGFTAGAAILPRDGRDFAGAIRIEGFLWDARVTASASGCAVVLSARTRSTARP